MARTHAAADAAVRELTAPEPEIVRATDLGGVQVLKRGDLYLLSDDFGDIRTDSRGLGLYSGDTRVVSCLAVKVNGARPVVLRRETGGNYRGTVHMTNGDYTRDSKEKTDSAVALARRSLGITRDRVVSNELHERLTISNYTQHPERVVVELAVDVDDADIFEVRGRRRAARGKRLPIHIRDDGRVTFEYLGLDGVTRCTYLETTQPDSIAGVRQPGEGAKSGDGAVVLRWERVIESSAEVHIDWHIWTAMSPVADAAKDAAPSTGLFPPRQKVDPTTGAEAYKSWREDTAEPGSDSGLFDLVMERSLADLRLLTMDGPEPGERYIAAGVPWYATLFGRDALITGLETLAFRPSIAVEALEVLAARQSNVTDDWRDAQPGKILHELRTGEMAGAGEVPHTPYYGSVDSTPLWLVLFAAVYDWTGDRGLLDRLWPNALAALRWIDEYGTGPDGLVAYERRSPMGLVNQGWKDSGDAIRNKAGTIVEPPIALAEVQGYVYDAKVRMAGLARVRGENEFAAHLESEAASLRSRFETSFWLPEAGFYAMAIGRDGMVADAIGSNAGHCLWSGIASPEHASRVATKFTEPSLDSGWGIRTYGAGQPGYNPIGYHTGSVWPHDNALIIAGLKRYGYHDAANILAGRIFESAQRFEGSRLPELFCGFPRDNVAEPVPYPVACSPQAWAAGAPLLILTSMLGLRAHADRHELELQRPYLPAWLGKITITNLRVGDATVDLLFHRWRGTTSAEVLRKQGDLAVTIHM